MTLAPAQIQELLDDMEKEVNDIKRTSLTFSWYMRGGVSYEDILNMSPFEREQISQIINDNLETTKKSQLPFF